MIDSHCHLAGTEFAGDLIEVIARAQTVGVVRCLVILAADDDAEFEQSERVQTAWPEVRFAVGVHPHNAHKFADGPEGAAGLTANRLDLVPGACAIGEIGLDYHYDVSPRDVQQKVFRAQLRLARERDLPVIIHTREAEEDTLRILSEESQGVLRGVFHCFTGNSDAAQRALATGFYLSLPGIVTFPKAGDLREAVRTIPPDRLLIETDSPYLAPLPHRGKRNEPAYVARVLETVAETRAIERSELSDMLVRNFDRLFGPTLSA